MCWNGDLNTSTANQSICQLIIFYCRFIIHTERPYIYIEKIEITYRLLQVAFIWLMYFRIICLPLRQRSWSYRVSKSCISDAHCSFQWKWQVLHNYDISVLQQVGLFFNGIACLVKVWPLIKREFPRVPMTWRSARARANFKCDVSDVNS